MEFQSIIFLCVSQEAIGNTNEVYVYEDLGFKDIKVM